MYNNLNEFYKDIKLDISTGSNFIHPHYADLYIKIDVLNTESSGTLTAYSKINLIDKFVPHLFTQVEVKKHSTILDNIDYPGIMSNAIVAIKFSKPEFEYFKISRHQTHANLPRKNA